MAEPHTMLGRSGAILTFTFDRPDKYNAFTRPMLAALRDAFETFAEDAGLRVLLIRATGRYFSSGMDVTALGAGPEDEGPSQFRRRYRESAWHRLYDEFEAIEKPIVVAHQGPCLGAALEMSLSCDFRLASDAAHYALPELNMGMIPGSGGTSRLVRTIGGHWARYMIMANRSIGADQARTVGLVHEVYPAGEFEREVEDFCLSLAAQPPEALAAAKLAIELAADLDRTQARNVERLANSSLFGRDEQTRVFAALRAQFSKSE
jgi:enoyl-CoA hydratase/carnithine racemase